MIWCRDLIKIFENSETGVRIPALRGCDLEVADGKMVSVVGPSGSGKTTLINILAGLEQTTSGEVQVGDYRLDLMSQKALNVYRLKMVGLVDQFPERTLFLDATVAENMKFITGLVGGSSQQSRKRNHDILKRLGIEHLAHRPVRFLSGGEMIRTAIACALAKGVPLLLCDEPTGQLDSLNTERVKELLRDVTREFGATILVVTHDPRFYDGVDNTCEIRDGRVSSMLTTEEQMMLNGSSGFPLRFRSQVDSTNNARIPDLVLKSLRIKGRIEYELHENGETRLKNPDNIPPKKVILEDFKVRRKVLTMTQLPSDYFDGKKMMIQVDTVSKVYTGNGSEVHALTDVSFKLAEGELIFILGPSGSGKTTLIKLLAGTERVTRGNIYVNGNNFTKLTDTERANFRRKNIGMVSQQGNLHPHLTIDENFFLKDIFSGLHLKEQELEKKNNPYLEKFNIIHRRNSFPLEISGGELQRASLAIASSGFPPIIILDEPTANFDSELAEQAMQEIYRIHESSNITFIIATHDISLIKDGIRAIELKDGRINQDGIVITQK
ncbi:MAG: ATP-binding cassette domain-containing protein [Candidatus Heimdallarchaeota archaeon]|nr:ATP-binding cassette domain-containing protein [Candidatus Heimdallarchaeota archaeon]